MRGCETTHLPHTLYRRGIGSLLLVSLAMFPACRDSSERREKAAGGAAVQGAEPPGAAPGAASANPVDAAGSRGATGAGAGAGAARAGLASPKPATLGREATGAGAVSKERLTPRQVRLGFPPFLDWEEVRGDFAPLLAHLEQATGSAVELVISDTYDALVDDLIAGKIDVASISPWLYLRARARPEARLRVVAQMRAGSGKPSYQGVILARSDRGYPNLGAARGSRIGWVDRGSASGYLFARLAVQAQGLDPRRHFREERFLGSHDAVLSALLARKIDLGAVWSQAYEQLEASQRTQLVELARTVDIPPDPLVLRGDLPHGLQQRLERAFLNLEPIAAEQRQRFLAHLGAAGWRGSSDADYDGIRTAFEMLGVDASADTPQKAGAKTPRKPE